MRRGVRAVLGLVLLLVGALGGCDYAVDAAYCGGGEKCETDAGSRDADEPDVAGGDAGCVKPAGQACGVVPQCGCEGTKACHEGPIGQFSCYEAGTSKTNAACTEPGDCAAGWTCEKSSWGDGLCKPYCLTSESSTCPSGVCAGSGDVGVCSASCDPLHPTACSPDGACGFVTLTTTQCVSPGTGTGVGGCSSGSTCAAGYQCVSPPGDCRRMCAPAASPNGCPASMPKCTPSTFVYQGAAIGICG